MIDRKLTPSDLYNKIKESLNSVKPSNQKPDYSLPKVGSHMSYGACRALATKHGYRYDYYRYRSGKISGLIG